jgi:hypothetical protein
MLEGNLAMFKSSMAILKMIENKFLNTTQVNDPNELFEDTLLQLNDVKMFKKYLLSIEFEDKVILNKKVSLLSQTMGNS